MLKIDKFTKHAHTLIHSKKAFDSITAILTACKDVFGSMKRCSLFIVDCLLQENLAAKIPLKNMREMPCSGVQSGVMIGISRTPEEFCAPVFSDVETGHKLVFNSRVISVPIIMPETESLIMTL
jgi:hypothetical protein